MHGDSLHVSACLALGKMGGKDGEGKGTDGLKRGDVLVWEKGAKQEFGDVDAIYIGYRVEEAST